MNEVNSKKPVNFGVAIDGVSVKLNTLHAAGQKVEYKDAKNGLLSVVPRKLRLRNDYKNTTVEVMASLDGRGLEAAGNPQKMLWGQNTVLSNRHGIVELFIRDALHRAEIPITDDIEECLSKKRYEFKHITLAANLRFDNADDIPAFLESLDYDLSNTDSKELVSTYSRGNELQSVYFRQKSTSWAFKAYAKGPEVHARPSSISPKIPDAARIRDFAKNTVRIEFVIRYRLLKKMGLSKASEWTPSTKRRLFAVMLRKLGLSSEFKLKLESGEELKLANAQRLAYIAYQHGYNLSNLLVKRTFYRYKADLAKVGININAVKPRPRPESMLSRKAIRKLATKGPPKWAIRAALFPYW